MGWDVVEHCIAADGVRRVTKYPFRLRHVSRLNVE